MTEEEDYEASKRAEAEARRKRIMEKSKDRMSKVSGLQTEEGDAEETTKTSASSSARMQAARRRRFKKGKAKTEESVAEKTEEGETATETKTEEKPAEDKAPTVVEEEKPSAEAATAEEPAKEEAKAAESAETTNPTTTEAKAEEPAKDETTTTTPAAEEPASATNEPKKKYKGVAKMRREKMLQKKKDEAAKAAEEEAKVLESPAVQARLKKRLKQPLLPIVMYIFTSFLLFLAGLDVGLQHANPDYTLVNREFAPQSFNLQKLNPWSSTSSGPSKDLGSDGDDAYTRDLAEDEFGTLDEEDTEYIPNIDPLFQVDLDELTRGPGLFNQLGRGAVKIHRTILYVLWEMPLQMLAMPARLFGYPPVMCLSALTIRQLIARVILGSKLPNSIEEDVRNAKGEMTDVLTMIKNAVKNTLSGLFPTAISAYEIFQQLKVDMYVILFGVFVGLLYSSWIPPPGLPSELEEEVPAMEPDPGIMEEEVPAEPDPSVVEEVMAAAEEVVQDVMAEAKEVVQETMAEEILQDGIADEL
ncbi:expressed unknown protein [Seminavis robusta]|uniref:Uncharacterized protein n=1 Tax=Seminavis robusta TaxID=568900 RepID=A0A9N8E1C3_9STRA|nr:expressed unknown protein [Seminavis robusta]|eukprot:Sro408_g136970.1 n/a (530) ;mRNA; f:36723-38312